jgi:transcriptional regulator GlxA family with amidase domain
LFKSETSLSPQEHARQRRLLRAKELLDGTFLKVNQVAAQVGFRHTSSFTREFKSHYGYPPSKSRGRLAAQ